MNIRSFTTIFLVQVISVLILVFSSAFAVRAIDTKLQTEVTDDETPLFMRAKLASTQKVIEGLVTEDYFLVNKGAEEMHKLSQASHWPQSTDKVYEHYSESFRLQCKKLSEQSQKKDLQAAHYTFMHMTSTCIDCHNYVRRKFRVKKDANNPTGPIQLIPTEWDGPAVRNRLPALPSNLLRDH